MNLEDWCSQAQKDQITDKNSLLYGNYRHSKMYSVLSDDGLSSFVQCLNSIAKPSHAGLRAFESSDYGYANIAADRAIWDLYKRPAASRPIDFRVSGPQIDRDDLFVNIQYRPIFTRSSSATHGGPPSSGLPAGVGPAYHKPYRITWLTLDSKLESRIKIAADTQPTGKLGRIQFFSEIVSLLGLRPSDHSPRYSCKVMLYKTISAGNIKRPHALSQGYPERFCGASRFQPYGSTADNRNGKAGLPEAVAFLSDLQEIEPDEPEYMNLRSELAKYTSFLPASASVRIEASIMVSDIHRNDNPSNFRSTVLKRLSRAHPSRKCPNIGSPDCVCSMAP